MYIIGHRGAAGLAPENTVLAIETGRKYKVDAVEFDIHATKDKKLILIHDDTLLRVAGDSRKVKDLTLAQIKKIETKSGLPIPTLAQAIHAAKNKQMIIEGKDGGWAELLATELRNHSGKPPKIISYDTRELFAFAQLMPDVETYSVADNHSVELLASAKNLGFSGVSLYAPLYNPFIYRMAKKYRLKLITSPINQLWRIRLFHFIYPRAMITTDFPDRVKNHALRQHNRKKKRSKKWR